MLFITSEDGMMKRMNFPGRKNKRRIGALDRYRKSLEAWFNNSHPDSPKHCQRIQREIKILEDRIN